ncbi:MAG: methionine synthase [Candidatus Bruticola sp.]
MAGVSFQDALKERVLVLDGAMGTMLQRYKLGESDYRTERFKNHPVNIKGNNDLLSITQPVVIQEIHRQYLEAGADIIETCTFGAQRITQSEYHTENLVREMNLAAARNARQAVADFLSRSGSNGRQAWVAGSIGPTGKTLSMSPSVEDASLRNITFDEMAEAYLEQILALQEGGVDLFLLETIFDALNAKAAIYALDLAKEKTGRSLPLMISVTISDKSGRTLCGQTLEAFWASVCHAKPLLFGINCALGAEDMAPHLSRISNLVNCGVSCYPNAGLPNAEGGYDETPEHMASVLADYVKKGQLNLVGGCCGTSPDYIRAIAQAVNGLKPRVIPEQQITPPVLSGLEMYSLPVRVKSGENSLAASFTMIGERCNLSGSAKFARLIRAKNYEAAVAVARLQAENGANVIDINLDDPMHDSVQEMEHFLRLLTAEPDIATLPIMLDSSHWEVLEAGLKSLAGRSLVNSISLKEGEAEFKRKALEIRRLGGLPVIMCFDENGQGDSLARKKEIADRACRILIDELGFAPTEIVLDLAVLSVATGIESHATYGLDFIEAVDYVCRTWPGVMTNGGISNVSFALRGNNPAREAMHAVFLRHACRAGLTMGIVNAGMLRNCEEIAPDLLQAVEDVILNKDPEASERLIEVAERHRSDSSASAVLSRHDDWRQSSVEERLKEALVRGITDFLEADIKEAVALGMSPLEIVEKALMGGMRHVGELFGSGRMFLPQVVKSARVMKKAVACLEPYFAENQAAKNLRGRILMATVKGDVHDIGKNIVSVVLGCNGFQVTDLGVMVPEQDIVAQAVESQAQLIGLSALITPSLDEIINVIKCLENAGLRIPVMVGGAATSPVHTAVKIAPHYSGLVVHVPDASLVTEVVNNILNPDSSECFAASLRAEQEELRSQWQQRLSNLELYSLEEAERRAPHFHWQAADIAVPQDPSVKVLNLDLRLLADYINWQEFLSAWGVKGSYPQILNDSEIGDKATKLCFDGRSVLEYIMRTESLKVRAVYGFWPARSQGRDILLYADKNANQPFLILPTLRQQTGGLEVCLSLADFVAPQNFTVPDWVGAFAVSAGDGLTELQAKYTEQGDEYHALIAGFLADRLCEAAAEYLHKLVRSECGYPDPESLTLRDIMLHHMRGIRPAPGYPACPDHAHKAVIWRLLQPEEKIGLQITDNFALKPASSICGFYFSAPWARYFSLGKIGRDQVEDYSRRSGIELAEAERRLAANLGYESR